MNKRTVKYNGTTYTAEFCLESLCFMEDDGFKTDDFDYLPFNSLLKLIHGAFYMHHPEMTAKEAGEIYSKGVTKKDKRVFVQDLAKFYTECAQDVMGDEGNEEGAAD